MSKEHIVLAGRYSAQANKIHDLATEYYDSCFSSNGRIPADPDKYSHERAEAARKLFMLSKDLMEEATGETMVVRFK